MLAERFGEKMKIEKLNEGDAGGQTGRQVAANEDSNPRRVSTTFFARLTAGVQFNAQAASRESRRAYCNLSLRTRQNCILTTHMKVLHWVTYRVERRYV